MKLRTIMILLETHLTNIVWTCGTNMTVTQSIPLAPNDKHINNCMNCTWNHQNTNLVIKIVNNVDCSRLLQIFFLSKFKNENLPTVLQIFLKFRKHAFVIRIICAHIACKFVWRLTGSLLCLLYLQQFIKSFKCSLVMSVIIMRLPTCLEW